MRIKVIFLFFSFTCCLCTRAQNIYTIAGTGVQAFSCPGGGFATTTNLSYAVGVTVVGGTVYFCDYNCSVVYKIDATGNLVIVAGRPGAFAVDGEGGPANVAAIGTPYGLTSDNAGNIYISSDYNGNAVIRKINTAGIITTLSNNPYGFAGDGGPIAAARFASIYQITCDNAGNLYFADLPNNRVRKMNTAGIVSTIAGTGVAGTTGDGGPATAARINNPIGVAVDNTGNVFIAEGSASNIRKINTGGIISTVAIGGNNNALATDNIGNLYIATKTYVDKLTPVGVQTRYAGLGGFGYSGDGGPAVNAGLTSSYITVDNGGNLYISAVSFFNTPVVRIVGCLPSVISQHPANVSICSVSDISFSTLASSGPLLQWQVNTGSGWSDIVNNATYSGTTTLTLNVTGANSAMNGYLYRCHILSSCSDEFTNPATLTAPPPPSPTININASSGTICSGTSVTFNAVITNGGTTPVYQWKKNGVNVGTNTSSYSDNTLNNGDIVSCSLSVNSGCATTTVTSNLVTMTVNTTVIPSISITSSGNNICAGSPITFNTIINNGGTTPAYQWKKNGTNTGTNASAYSDNVLANGDIITCMLTSDNACALPSTAVSNTVTMIVNPVLTASITVNTTNTTICAGTLANFSTVIANGGTAPIYQWKKNGTNVGTNSPAYSDNTLSNGDIISCNLVSNLACANPLSVAGNSILMTVNPMVSPTITIGSSANNICAGVPVSFNATITNGGTAPVYQWKKNGTNVGTNSAAYSDNVLNNGDIITCQLLSNAGCATTPIVTSSGIIMNVTTVVTPTVTITASASSICAGGAVTFTMSTTNAGTAPQYTWFRNSTNLFVNSSTYTDNTLANGDAVFGVLQSSLACISSSAVVSNPITTTVNPVVTPSISISTATNTICTGANTGFSSSIANGGTAPIYQWLKNGVLIGTNSPSYSDNTIITGDMILCRLTSNAACTTTPSSGSNTITMAVNPNPVVTLDHTLTLCNGSTRQLDAGNFASYLWSNGSMNETLTVNTTGIYSVIVTDNNGCKGTDATIISTLLPKPAGFLPGTTSFCRFDSLQLACLPLYTNYSWSTGSSLPFIFIKRPGSYWLDVTDNNNCTGRNTVIVTMNECLKGFYMPTAFSPNNDGRNDLLQPQLFGEIKKYEFWIYNRWGTLVFHSKDISQGWDGTYQGKLLDSAVFVWLVSYQLNGEPEKMQKGTATLIK